MRTLKADTQAGRLLRVLVARYPKWTRSGFEHFGYDGLSARNRMDDALGARGLTIDRRPADVDERTGKRRSSVFEWRLLDRETYIRAALLVRSWDTGEDYETLLDSDPMLAEEIRRRESSPTVAETQRALPL